MNQLVQSFIPNRELNINPNQPAPFVPKFFIEALTKMGGLADNSRDAKFRLVWGGTAMHFAYGRMRIKYLRYSQKVPIAWEVVKDGERLMLPISAMGEDGGVGRIIKDWLDEGIQRFFIEEWCPPEEACRGWELHRYDDNGEDVLGPIPSDGLYSRWICLQTDEGGYMPPNQQTLDWIERMFWIREHDETLKSWTWRERPPTHVVEGVMRQKYYELYKADEKSYEDLAEHYESMLMPALHRLTDTPIIIK